MAMNYPAHPRVRAYGKARLDLAQRLKTPQDWQRLWKPPIHPFPFVWGQHWKQCVEYRVDDFPAEVGFFIDVLGFSVNALDPGYAMFTSPDRDFFFAVLPASEEEPSTPPDAFRLQFMVADILAAAAELERRGVAFEQPPQPCQGDSSLYIGYFRTPHGLCVDLWGWVAAQPSLQPFAESAATRPSSFDRPQDDPDWQEDDDQDSFWEEQEPEPGVSSPLGGWPITPGRLNKPLPAAPNRRLSFVEPPDEQPPPLEPEYVDEDL